MRTDILFVEDDLTDQFLIARGLEEAGFGYSFSFAQSVEDALCVLDDYEKPKIVVTDLNMPFIGGYEFLRIRQSRPDLIQIPFIVFSGSADTEDMLASFAVGADAYIEKPFSMKGYSELVECLQSHLTMSSMPQAA